MDLSADHLTDHDIALALVSELVLVAVAKVLTDRHGRVVSPGDLRARIEAVLDVREHAPAGYAILGGLRGALIDLPMP
jgi:hypothetical protein